MAKSLFKFYGIALLICFSIRNISSQDIQFSQFYTANIYQNPAFAGSTHFTRMMAHSRIQWPGLNKNSTVGGKFFTYFAGMDTYLRRQKSGIGFIALRDEMGLQRINNTEIHGMYSYEVDINNRFTFRPGLQLGIVQRSYDYQNLLFPRELSDSGVITNSYTLSGGPNKLYPDISSGFLFYDNAFWLGYSVHHINNPNVGTIGISKLPLNHSITSGYKIILHSKNTLNYKTTDKVEFSITPTVHYKFQGKADQFDAGIYGIYDWFLAGFWYRGIPFKKLKGINYVNNESVVAQTGFRWDRWTINYSYDFVVSKLGGIRQSGGAHEINITYIFKPHLRVGGNKPTKRLPCPDFERHILHDAGDQPSPGGGY